MIYLASPYSHPDSEIRELRYRQACDTLTTLMRQGHRVFSPIVHSHPLALRGLACDWEFWSAFDVEMIGFAEAVWVLKIDGWRESKGIQRELQIACRLDKPIKYIDPIDGGDQFGQVFHGPTFYCPDLPKATGILVTKGGHKT